jgi:hypothetical protein
MHERRFHTESLRKIARATLAFLAWLHGGAASADTDGQAREAHRRLRALSRPRPPRRTTSIYDSLGRLRQTTHTPAPAAYSLCLGDAGELLVTTRTDVFVFALDAREALHFVARRRLPPCGSEGDRPS